MDWEIAKIVTEAENAKATVYKLRNRDYVSKTLSKYLNGYELNEIDNLALIAYFAFDRIIKLIKNGYERKLNEKKNG